MQSYESVKSIIHEPDLVSLNEDFVAIAMSVNDLGEGIHCGLAINCKEKLQLFHFDFGDGDRVSFDDFKKIKSIYFLNKIPLITKQEVEAFLTKCEMLESSDPDLEFGFFYNGEFVNDEGKLIFKMEKNNITNCVFFCISLVSGFLVGENYIDFKAWGPDEFATSWFNGFNKRRFKNKFTDQELNELMSSLRRIVPLDYFSCGNITKLPITKAAIEEYSIFVNPIIKERTTRILAERALKSADK